MEPGQPRRLSAGRRPPTVTAVIHDRNLGPADLPATRVTENALREDLKPVEQAKACTRLMDLHGWTAIELAGEMGDSQGAVSKSLALLNLSDDVEAQVEFGYPTPSIT